MIEHYFRTASELMDLSHQCTDEDAINILKTGSEKIFELAKSHGGFIKTAEEKVDPAAE